LHTDPPARASNNQLPDWADSVSAPGHFRNAIMNAQKFLGLSLSLVLGAGSALAAQLPAVQVRGENEYALTIACDNPTQPSKDEVARILHVTRNEQTNALRNKLMAAAAEACQAGEARILVQRTATGKLTWVAMQ
jgi:hypothetical protein